LATPQYYSFIPLTTVSSTRVAVASQRLVQWRKLQTLRYLRREMRRAAPGYRFRAFARCQLQEDTTTAT